MRILLLGMVLLSAVCGFAAEPNLSPEDRKFIETHFQIARSAEAAQQYDQAAREYEIILKKFPTLVPHVYQNLGIVYYYRQKYEDAERTFEAGLRIQPDMLGSRFLLGRSYLATQQPEKAQPHLEYVHKRQPTFETALYLGQSYMPLLQYEKAVSYLESAMSLADAQSKATPLHLLGQSYLRMAERIVNSETQAHPDSSHTRLAAAKIFESQDRYQVAAIMLLETAKLDPMNASLFFPLARMLAILGLEDASRLALERYRSLMPSDRQATLDETTLPRSRVAEIGTKVDFEGILRVLPPVKAPPLPMFSADINSAVSERLARDGGGRWKAVVESLSSGELEQVLKRLDSYKLALVHLDRLIADFPDSCPAHLVKGENLASQGKPEAETEFRAAIAACPAETRIRLALADFYLGNAKLDEALAECLKEIELNPYSNEAKVRIGRIYIQQRDAQKGVRFLTQALRADPEDANARVDLARGYELLEQWEKAVEEYNRALRSDPSLNRVHYVLARLYRQLGRNDLAQKENEAYRLNDARQREQQEKRIDALRGPRDP